jgi:tetratricopeptide (TPR) repeat protein
MLYQLPPLSDEDQFENLVRDILRRVYRDPGIERFGRKGQAQFGIDGISPAHSGVTFQCKLKDTRYAPDDQIQTKLLSEMEEEFAKTKGWTEPLTHFIFASTFKNDRVLQQKARSLSSSTTEVEYLGWDTINERVWEYAEELIPLYYPEFQIRRVPGFRQITTQLIEESQTISDKQKTLLALEYYRINDRADVVFQVVCNDMDVRNTKVMNEIHYRVQRLPASATLWLVGAGGSGKTTILYRTATELAQQDHVVFTLDLEADLRQSDLATILSLIKHRSVESCVLCVDNPAADEEMLETLLRELPNFTSKIHVILAERAHRYRALRRTGTLTYLHGDEDLEPINVRNPRNQREDVYQRLFTLLNVSEEDRAPLLDIVRNESLVYVNATYRILLELKKKRKIDFDFDWDDYRKSVSDLAAFREGYKYIALFYLFGVRTPFITFARVHGANESHQRGFLEKFRGQVNEPIIVNETRDESQRKITHLRTKHEIVSEIFFQEHSDIDKDELLKEWAEHTDFGSYAEAQALITIFGARKNYLADTPHVSFQTLIDFLLCGYLRDQIAQSPRLTGALQLGKYWLLTANGKADEAIASLESFVAAQPKDLHSRTELAKAYQQTNRLDQAERLLQEILDLAPDDLRARTELSKIYQRQGKLSLGESVLLELLQIDEDNFMDLTELAKIYQKQDRLAEAEAALAWILQIRPRDLNSRTELAKIYQRQGKLKEAEERLLESLAIDDKQLHPRTELAKIYQRQGKLKEGEDILMELLRLEPADLQARTELAKIYQRQGKLKEAEDVLMELLRLQPDNLQARTELAKIYQRQGKLKEAEERLLESLAIDDKQLHPRTELAKIYQRQDKLDLAARYAEESLSIDPLNNHAMSELLAIWMRQGEGEKAARRFIEFIDQSEYKFTRSSQAPVFRFFQCCRRFGMADQARQVYERFGSQLDERNIELFNNVFRDT